MENKDEEPIIVKKQRPKRNISKKKKGKTGKNGEKSTTQLFLTELISALALIAGGMALAYYAEDISAYVGEKVQEMADSVFGNE